LSGGGDELLVGHGFALWRGLSLPAIASWSLRCAA